MSLKKKENNRCFCGSGKKHKNCCKILNEEKTNDKLLNLMIQMNSYADTAQELYKKCIDEGCNDCIDPNNWILNQDNMRDCWENYKLKLEISPDFFRNVMLNNSFSNYMSFMYDTYPIGFGNILKEFYKNKIDCDGAMIFYNLKNNTK